MPDELDDDPQLNKLLVTLRDRIKSVIKSRGYGHIRVDGVIHAGVIVGSVECGVTPRDYYGSIPKSPGK